MATIYCTDTQDRIPFEYFAQGKAVWCGGKPYLKFAADKLRLRPDPAPPARYAVMLAGVQPPPAVSSSSSASSSSRSPQGPPSRGLDLTPMPFQARKSSPAVPATPSAPEKQPPPKMPPAPAPQPEVRSAVARSAPMPVPAQPVAKPAPAPARVIAAPPPAPPLDSPTAMRIQMPKFAMDPPSPAPEPQPKAQRSGGTTMIAKRGVFSWEKLEKSSPQPARQASSRDEDMSKPPRND